VLYERGVFLCPENGYRARTIKKPPRMGRQNSSEEN
jgi:hypothetical protein